VERGSTQHGSRVDDELAHETRPMTQGAPLESRVEEEFEKEGPADGEPMPDARLAGDRSPPVPAMSLDEVEARSELARHLEPGRFPARPAELVAMATEQHAPDEMVLALARLPDQAYETVGEVWVALGGHHERRTPAPATTEPAHAPGGEHVPVAGDAAPAPLQLLALPVAMGLRVAVGAVHVAGDLVRRARALLGHITPTG
jgi:hypothetical protein